MNIAFFHKDVWPPIEGSSLQSWQLYSRLRKHHVIYSPQTCPFPDAKKRYRNIRDARRMLQSIDAVFIIVDGFFNFFNEKFSCLPTLLLLQKPVVWLLNAPIEESLLFPQYNKYALPIERLERKILSSFVDVCICVSHVLEAYARHHLLARTYTVIANGSDPYFFRPHRKPFSKKRYKRDNFNIVWAGSGENPWHAIDVIGRVAEIMSHRDPSVTFTLVTNKPWHPLPLLPNLRMVGAKDYFQMPDELTGADLALCLYHEMLPLGFYNSPLKLFSAMSAGLPVVATDIGQMHDIIVNRQNGFLTRNDPNEIVSIIEFVKLNPDLAHQIGLRARKLVVSYYNWDRMVQEINTVLYRLAPSPR